MEKRRKQIYNNYLLFRERYDLNKEIDFLNFLFRKHSLSWLNYNLPETTKIISVKKVIFQLIYLPLEKSSLRACFSFKTMLLFSKKQ